MQSFHKIIKAQQSVSDEGSALIQTELRRKPLADALPESHAEREPFQEEKQAAARCLEEAQAEKGAIIQQAQTEAEEIRVLAHADGFQKGEHEGKQAGFQSGYQAGMETAQKEATGLKKAAQQMLADAALEVAAFQADKRAEIIGLAAQMAEKIVYEKIAASDDKILTLIHPVLSRMEQESKFITLTVTPELQSLMKEKAKGLGADFPLYRFAILVDPNLEEHGCIIESSHAIIDLQVSKQLEAMVAELKGIPVADHV